MSRHGRHVRKKRNRTLKWGAFLSFSVAFAASVWYVMKSPMKPVTTVHRIVHAHARPATPPPTPHRTNVLLIGTDARPGDTNGNTDTLILASIDEIHDRIELLSIPRDTQIAFPDGRYYKINRALEVGGPDLAMTLVQNLLAVPVSHYAIAHFDGLVNIIDTLGGLEMNVKERMRYDTGDRTYHRIDLHPGEQLLSGSQALGYVRFRHDALGDIGRTQRQQDFLKALSAQLWTSGNLAHLPRLIPEMWHSVDTNLSLLDVTSLAAKSARIRAYPVIHETLPGSFHNPTPGNPLDLSYWVVNPSQARYVAKAFFENGEVISNPVQDPLVTQTWQPDAKSSVAPNTPADRSEQTEIRTSPSLDAPIRITTLPGHRRHEN